MFGDITQFWANTLQMVRDYPSSLWLFVLFILYAVSLAFSLLGNSDPDKEVSAGLTEDGRTAKRLFGRGEVLILRPAGGRTLRVGQNMKGYHQLYDQLCGVEESWDHPHA